MARIYNHPLKLARLKYQRHRAQAKFRNIAFNFTFEEWYDWWLNNGVDKNLPQDTFAKSDANRLCMCRYNDTGPYELGNVYLDTHVANAQSARILERDGVKQRKQQANYRWGDSLVTLREIKSLTTEKPLYFLAKDYDRHRVTESRQLYNRLLKEHGSLKNRTYWHWQGSWYKRQKDLLKAARMDISKYRRNMAMGLSGYATKVTPTVEEWFKQHSRYPDPLIPKE